MEHLREEDNRIYGAITESEEPTEATRPTPKKETRTAQLKEAPPSAKKDARPSPKKETYPSPTESSRPAPKKETSRAPKKETSRAPKKETSPTPKKETSRAPKKETSPSPSKETRPEQSGTGDFRCEKTGNEYDLTRRAPRFGGSFSLRDFFRSISPENWVDIFCLPITCVGILFIITEFQAVTEGLFRLLYPVIEAAVFVLGIAVLVAVLWLMIRRRRRYYWY